MQRRSVPASEQKQKHRSGSGQDLATGRIQGQDFAPRIRAVDHSLNRYRDLLFSTERDLKERHLMRMRSVVESPIAPKVRKTHGDDSKTRSLFSPISIPTLCR
jgi:hypothetical protein